MAINLSDNVLAKTTAPADAKYGPYSGADIAAAKSAATSYLDASYRYKGLTVALVVGSTLTEYWFKDGITDSDLIAKSGGGSISVEDSGTEIKSDADVINFTGNIKASLVSGVVNVTSDTFTHSNGTNTVWSITHNLGKYPSVTVISSAGEEIFGELTFTNANAIQLTFSEAIAGTAYLN
jgi:hypothetical protein